MACSVPVLYSDMLQVYLVAPGTHAMLSSHQAGVPCPCMPADQERMAACRRLLFPSARRSQWSGIGTLHSLTGVLRIHCELGALEEQDCLWVPTLPCLQLLLIRLQELHGLSLRHIACSLFYGRGEGALGKCPKQNFCRQMRSWGRPYDALCHLGNALGSFGSMLAAGS